MITRIIQRHRATTMITNSPKICHHLIQVKKIYSTFLPTLIPIISHNNKRSLPQRRTESKQIATRRQRLAFTLMHHLHPQILTTTSKPLTLLPVTSTTFRPTSIQIIFLRTQMPSSRKCPTIVTKNICRQHPEILTKVLTIPLPFSTNSFLLPTWPLHHPRHRMEV